MSYPHYLVNDYRIYDLVICNQVEMIWLDEMLTLFQSINRSMKYPSEIHIPLIIPTQVGYKTYPYASKIIKQLGDAGFRMELFPDKIIGYKG